MRARQPDRCGFVERDRVRTAYEVYGEGSTTLLLLPPWAIVDSRVWKMQVPYLARHYRVVTFDGRGNGRSDRPCGSAAYLAVEYAQDARAVLDATQTQRAVVVAFSRGARWALELNALCAERVDALIFVAPRAIAGSDRQRNAEAGLFERVLDSHDGWLKFNAEYWRRDYASFLQFFWEQALPEAHSTRAIEQGVEWGLQTSPETLIETQRAAMLDESRDATGLLEHVQCRCLVIHGTDDRIVGPDAGVKLAKALGPRAELVELHGSGHAPQLRDPVSVNTHIRDFVDRVVTPATQHTQSHARARRARRPKRALFLSSPIGLGHARRDVAIADSLRRARPDLQIEWLAQNPVTHVLAARGETIHPASTWLASESAHITTESGDGDLHVFNAWRRMDEILLANYMVFDDIAADRDYDLWIGDEAWELDYYLHEHPERKRAAYVWLTDFVGWLPIPELGTREAYLTADYNAQTLEHIARFPQVRDRSLFIGAPDDIVADRFGPALPPIRAWTETHYQFSGDYITGFASADVSDRDALRAELGYRSDETVCVVSVGGSGVGVHLLRCVMQAYPLARAAMPNLRMVVVAGPRIDPRQLPELPGVEVRAYVPDLYRHLAACDLAVVQGGLTTTMELVASQRPFLYFPLGRHFEQTFYVPHRLARYGAGRRMELASATPASIAQAMTEEIGRRVTYRPIDPNAVERVAAFIGDLL